MNLLALDIETTGVDATKTNPVQISMIAVYPGEAGVTQHRRILMNTLCDPGESIPKDATAVHGITDKDVQGKPDAAIACWQAEHIASLAHPNVLVTYNGRLFDVPIISFLDVYTYARSKSGVWWIAAGERIADSIVRRAMIKGDGGVVNPKRGRFPPSRTGASRTCTPTSGITG